MLIGSLNSPKRWGCGDIRDEEQWPFSIRVPPHIPKIFGMASEGEQVCLGGDTCRVYFLAAEQNAHCEEEEMPEPGDWSTCTEDAEEVGGGEYPP
ncbi:hypothetical protein SKAU_G00361090 [Synaphobranchus kaupii]|uniref:Uncharacterized protein n=1 Tax=Synaphobranchus kaupii TaxID=118154 RepID=A0A9Q1EIC4_SYNKA|nr:hypothetical protein SKAU_G00361090 [Synaphobranchus kaupii]